MIGGEWQPLLVGAAAHEARWVVDEIACELTARSPSEQPGFKGDLSTALLLAELNAPEAAPMLERALSTAVTQSLTISLFGGLSGYSWLLHQVAHGPEAAALVAHFDDSLTEHLDASIALERQDLISGLAGAGVMLAERGDARAHELAARVLTHLETTALEFDEGVTWRTEPRFLSPPLVARFPNGMFDVGVAHGSPGILGMLVQFVEAGVERQRSESLLRRAIRWLFANAPDATPRFGTAWREGDIIKRIGWCYGDLGVGGVMLRASRAIGDPQLAECAVEMLQRITIPLAARDVPDAGFCHGAAGYAHLYNLAFQQTGNRLFEEQAIRWVREVLRLRVPGTGLAGYTSFTIRGAGPERVVDTTLLSGVVGTALVLLSAIGNREPAWQKLFVM